MMPMDGSYHLDDKNLKLFLLPLSSMYVTTLNYTSLNVVATDVNHVLRILIHDIWLIIVFHYIVLVMNISWLPMNKQC